MKYFSIVGVPNLLKPIAKMILQDPLQRHLLHWVIPSLHMPALTSKNSVQLKLFMWMYLAMIINFTNNSDVDANVIAKDVILGSRSNINFLHEVFRRALLMNFVHTVAIRRVICVYKDWIQMNVPELPVFMLEPEDGADSEHSPTIAGSLDTPKGRLRADSYYGAVGINANNNREEYMSHLRAGGQKILQIFFVNSASVFLLFQIPKHEAAMAFLEEQVDICKRVLNIYRYAVMNTRMSSETWLVIFSFSTLIINLKL